MEINFGDAVLAWCEKHDESLPDKKEVEMLNAVNQPLKPQKKREWLIEEENGGCFYPIERFDHEITAKKFYKKYKNIDSSLTELIYGIPTTSITGQKLLKIEQGD